MKSHFVEIPLSLVREDSRCVDDDNRIIYEHLLYLYRYNNCFPLPAIDVIMIHDTLVVARGHKDSNSGGPHSVGAPGWIPVTRIHPELAV